MAGFKERNLSSATGAETMSRVESLPNPASTLTYFEAMGSIASQSENKSGWSSVGLMSSLIGILKSSRGYSGS
jgi:hypothetical protein